MNLSDWAIRASYRAGYLDALNGTSLPGDLPAEARAAYLSGQLAARLAVAA